MTGKRTTSFDPLAGQGKVVLFNSSTSGIVKYAQSNHFHVCFRLFVFKHKGSVVLF